MLEFNSVIQTDDKNFLISQFSSDSFVLKKKDENRACYSNLLVFLNSITKRKIACIDIKNLMNSYFFSLETPYVAYFIQNNDVSINSNSININFTDVRAMLEPLKLKNGSSFDFYEKNVKLISSFLKRNKFYREYFEFCFRINYLGLLSLLRSDVSDKNKSLTSDISSSKDTNSHMFLECVFFEEIFGFPENQFIELRFLYLVNVYIEKKTLSLHLEVELFELKLLASLLGDQRYTKNNDVDTFVGDALTIIMVLNGIGPSFGIANNLSFPDVSIKLIENSVEYIAIQYSNNNLYFLRSRIGSTEVSTDVPELSILNFLSLSNLANVHIKRIDDKFKKLKEYIDTKDNVVLINDALNGNSSPVTTFIRKMLKFENRLTLQYKKDKNEIQCLKLQIKFKIKENEVYLDNDYVYKHEEYEHLDKVFIFAHLKGSPKRKILFINSRFDKIGTVDISKKKDLINFISFNANFELKCVKFSSLSDFAADIDTTHLFLKYLLFNDTTSILFPKILFYYMLLPKQQWMVEDWQTRLPESYRPVIKGNDATSLIYKLFWEQKGDYMSLHADAHDLYYFFEESTTILQERIGNEELLNFGQQHKSSHVILSINKFEIDASINWMIANDICGIGKII